MVYAAELDDAPREVRRGFASNVQRWWPKIVGVGNVQADASPAPTFAVSKPDGTLITSPPITITPVVVGGVHRFDMTIDASSTTTYQLAENYRIDILWTYGGVQLLEQDRFACCVAPYAAHISLNDLLEEVADCAQTLAAQAQAIADGRTAEQHASVLGVKAWADVYLWLQARLRDEGKVSARLIVNRWKIQPVIKAQTLYRLYFAEGGTGRARELAELWKGEARARFSAIGDLDYDPEDQGVATETIHSPVDWSCERSW